MKKALPLAFALAFCLAGCGSQSGPVPTATPAPAPTPAPTAEATPAPSEEPTELWGFPIDDTHDAFEVDTKGRLGTVLVTVEAIESDELYRFAVWAQGNTETPIQEMEAEGWCSGIFRDFAVEDINFDGYMDFGYQRSWGTGGFFYHHWVWDEEKGQFTAVPELTEYGDIVFDAETETVIAHAKVGFAGLDAWDDIYVWENGKPVCVRKIRWLPRLEEDSSIVVKITVSDRVDRQLTEVYSSDHTEENFWEETTKWYDLSYHG